MIKLNGDVDATDDAVAGQPPEPPKDFDPTPSSGESMADEVAESACPTSADVSHRQAVADASAEVAASAVDWSESQEIAKAAKKRFDAAVENLRRIVSKGPEDLPLFDGAKETGQPMVEAIDGDYLPALERSQVRVRMIRLGDTAEYDIASGDVLICKIDSDGDILWHPPSMDDDEGGLVLDKSEDCFEILEEWPDDADAPTLHAEPIRFGEAKDEEASTDPDAWKTAKLGELGLPPVVHAKIEEEGITTIGGLEELRAEISQGTRKWPKGIGPAKITLIEDRVLDWLRDHQEQ